MKFNLTFKLFGFALNKMIKNNIKDKTILKNIKSSYKQIVNNASDIGSSNMLLSSYALCAYFIAMNRTTNLSPEENLAILEKEIRTSKLLKTFMGSSKSYFSEKKMQKRREWSKETHKKKYKNDWVVDVIEKDDDFVFGLDYHECGVCKLCRDENCFHLAKYLCRLDFLLVEIIGIKLRRTKTLAEGFDCCDFRFLEK